MAKVLEQKLLEQNLFWLCEASPMPTIDSLRTETQEAYVRSQVPSCGWMGQESVALNPICPFLPPPCAHVGNSALSIY